jgi:pyruvate dehydrogenase E2 component (dihydrolipoamide acetyltransferase)
MPQMGESIAEGTLSRWLKKVGDEVKRDEAIFEISTDKVDAEIPSPTSGVLAEIIVKEGETVPVQAVVARIETEKGAAVAAPAAEPSQPAAASAPSPAAAATSTSQPAGSGGASPPAPSPGNGGAGFEERIRTKSSPLVRKIAAEHGIELAQMRGSGVAGRVTKKDIVELIESGAAKPAPARTGVSTYAPGGTDSHGPAAQPWPGDVVEPMSKIRQLTSDHMVLARRTAAHVTSFFEIDLTRVARIRAKMRADFEKQNGQKLTYLPFIAAATAKMLKQHRVLNAAVSGQNIIYRSRVNLGIAVALDWGLIVPVVKNAEDLSLAGLTKAINDLAGRARNRKLQPQEVQDATFSISNFGVFGSLMGTPIIPVGTSAILGLGAIEKRPKVMTGADGEDTIAIRTCAYFSISFDHRIVDGADADQFMSDLKKALETWPEAAV